MMEHKSGPNQVYAVMGIGRLVNGFLSKVSVLKVFKSERDAYAYRKYFMALPAEAPEKAEFFKPHHVISTEVRKVDLMEGFVV